MKLQEFLKSGDKLDHRRPVTELKFLEMLKDNCRNSYGVVRRSPIYVADKSLKENFYAVAPEAREVRTAFWVDRIVREMHSWKRFPSRSKFIRGYTTVDRAGDESNVYVVFPYDMSRVGICPTASFYRSFQRAQKEFRVPRVDNDGLSTWIVTLCRGLNALDGGLDLPASDPDTAAQLERVLGKVDRAMEKKDALKKKLREHDSMRDDEKSAVKGLLDGYVTTAKSYLEARLDPEENGFSCVRVESFTRPTDVREVWVDKPCLLVKRDKYIEMHRRGAVK